MLAILYLILACMTGFVFLHALFRKTFFEKPSGQNMIWIAVPSAFGFGTLLLTWPLYILAYFFHTKMQAAKPLGPANLIVMLVSALIVAAYFFVQKKKDGFRELKPVCDRKLFIREAILYAAVLLFVTLSIFHVFFVTKDGTICAGYTVFSDYAPHVSMIRSFSKQANFPTQYPFYGGSDVKYHFMFQFLTGNLEFLGLRLDFAYNLPSILALVGFLMLATQLSYRLFTSFAAELFVPALFFFRSGTAIVQFMIEHLQSHDLIEAIKQNRSFIGYTENENWGLWNYNVYLNQRHLAFGLLVAAAVIWFFLFYADTACADSENGRLKWFAARWSKKSAWIFEDPLRALLLGVLLGSATFWNGAAVIGALLILCGMAVFSDHKLDYLILAISAVCVSVLQTHVFIKESAFKATFYWGFILDEPSLFGVLVYLGQIMGITILGAVVLQILLQKRQVRILLFCFLLPVVFAFTISLTPDVTVNQKYIMIAAAFLSIIWGGVLAALWKKKAAGRACMVLLLVLLTANGLYDFLIIIRDNGFDHSYQVDLNSDVTAWLDENLTSEDLVLAPSSYTFHEVPMSGIMMYRGYAYYAWSAGYDIEYRSSVSTAIYTTTDSEVIKELTKKEGIDYIIYDEYGQTLDDSETLISEDAIKEACELVYTSKDSCIRIYKVK